MTEKTKNLIGLYRVFVVVLLGLVGVQGWMLVQADDDALASEPEEPKDETITSPASPDDSTHIPEVTERGLRMINLEENLDWIPIRFSDASEYTEWLSLSEYGGVRTRVLGFDLEEPLHYHRRQHTAAYVISGQGFFETVCGSAEHRRMDVAQGDVITIEPYCGYRWGNPNTGQMLALLEYVTPGPLNERLSDSVFAEVDDPYARLGGEPHAQQQIHVVVGEQGESLPLLPLAGQLRREVVLDEVSHPASEGDMSMFVLAGTGTLTASTNETLRPGLFVIVPAHSPFVLRATETPLVVLWFNPAEDGVSELVRHGESLYSQVAEERVARSFFNDQTEGVFLDIGAGHYQHISTTYYLEEHLNWSGIAVDGQANYAAGFVEHRPRTQFFAYLITDEDRGDDTLYLDPRVPVAASMEPELVQEQTEAAIGETELEELIVPTISLNSLLSQLEIERIDFLSMDIEGHEPEALSGFDIERYRPELVCIESSGRTQNTLYEYFVAHGYERLDEYLAYDSVNWYFAPIDRQ